MERERWLEGRLWGGENEGGKSNEEGRKGGRKRGRKGGREGGKEKYLGE